MTPAGHLASLALSEGLRGRHAKPCALVLFVIRAQTSPKGRRWGRAASVRRALELVDATRAVLVAMLEAEAP